MLEEDKLKFMHSKLHLNFKIHAFFYKQNFYKQRQAETGKK